MSKKKEKLNPQIKYNNKTGAELKNNLFKINNRKINEQIYYLPKEVIELSDSKLDNLSLELNKLENNNLSSDDDNIFSHNYLQSLLKNNVNSYKIKIHQLNKQIKQFLSMNTPWNTHIINLIKELSYSYLELLKCNSLFVEFKQRDFKKYYNDAKNNYILPVERDKQLGPQTNKNIEIYKMCGFVDDVNLMRNCIYDTGNFYNFTKRHRFNHPEYCRYLVEILILTLEN